MWLSAKINDLLLLGAQYWAADGLGGYLVNVCVGTDCGLGCCGIDGIIAGSYC